MEEGVQNRMAKRKTPFEGKVTGSKDSMDRVAPKGSLIPPRTSGNEVNLNIRISESLRDEWHEACRKKSINGSALIRSWIQQFVDDSKKEGG